MERVLKNIIIIVSFFLVSLESKAERPFEIERSEVLEFFSKKLNKTYDIAIKLPRGYQKNISKRYPTIYLTDSGYAFPLVSSLTKQMVGGGKIDDLIIVGMSYSKEERWDISRTRDYTPTHSPEEKIGFSKEAKEASGGAKMYLEFINKELFHFIDKKYRTDSSKRIFAGHSFGGLWGAYVIKVQPNTFDYYILSDPSLWYDSETVLNLRSSLSKGMTANVLIVSSNPSEPLKRGGFPHNMVANAKKLERQLVDDLAKDSDVASEIYNGQIHETIFPVAVTQGLLRFIEQLAGKIT